MRSGNGVTSRGATPPGRRRLCSAVVAAACAVLAGACTDARTNPTPGAVPFAFGKAWLRHIQDKYDRDANVVVGFTLVDRAQNPVAANGKLDVELKWSVGLLEWTLEGEVDIDAASFVPAEDRPVADGTWSIEPWTAYLIGPSSPGASQDGYETTLTFTTEDGRSFQYYRWLRPEPAG